MAPGCAGAFRSSAAPEQTPVQLRDCPLSLGRASTWAELDFLGKTEQVGTNSTCTHLGDVWSPGFGGLMCWRVLGSGWR